MSDPYFGEQPERDMVQLSSVETSLFADLVLEYGDFVDPDTTHRQFFRVVQDAPATPAPQSGATLAPTGFGAGSVEQARDALAEADAARKATLNAHQSWIDLGDRLDDHRRNVEHYVRIIALLGFLVGLALGCGLTGLLFKAAGR